MSTLSYFTGGKGLPYSADRAVSPQRPIVWYDPSDYRTLCQDLAGTIPVTGVEQYVGLMKDKSGNGRHAFPTADTQRGILSARCNMLNQSESITGWNSAAVGSATMPGYFGEYNGIKVVCKAASGDTSNKTTQIGPLPANTKVTASVIVDVASMTSDLVTLLLVSFPSSGGIQYFGGAFNRATLEKPTTSYLNKVPDSFTAVNISGTVWLLTLTGSWDSDSGSSRVYCYCSGDGSLIIGKPQAYVGTAPMRYQRVVDAGNYESAGFPHYIKFDGVNTAYQTAPIDLTYTSKMTVVAGVRVDIAQGSKCIAEFGVGYGPGKFYMFKNEYPNDNSFNITASVSGSGAPMIIPQAGYSDYVASASASFTDSFRTSRLDAGTALLSPQTVTGTLGNFPLYIGSRGGNSYQMPGRYYGFSLFDQVLPETSLRAVESFMAEMQERALAAT